jgi:hypothetical protein
MFAFNIRIKHNLHALIIVKGIQSRKTILITNMVIINSISR